MFDMGISDTVKEHEQDMDILMRRIKAKGNDLKDPFHLVDKTERYPLYDEATHWKLKKPKLGEKFVTVEQFKECLTYYTLANGFSLWNERSSTDEVIAKCGQRKEVIKDPSKRKQRAYKKFLTKDPNEASSHSICPWRYYAKKLKVDGSFQVISLKDEHTGVKNFNYGTLINYKWLGKHFGDKIKANPKITLHALADLVMKKYSCIVSPNQCRRAKEYALSEVKVGVSEPDEKTYFDRFYVCLHGLKEGWKLGCRKIIALDGCFLKKPNSGEILTAVGRDGNNQIYHVAWAIVNVKNKENWCWFLSLLGEDLEFPDGSGLTLMSDQHKGLIEAVKQVMPYPEHRQCVCHIYEGFRKEFNGIEFRLLFWAESKGSYPQLFTKIMEKIKKANPKAHEYLSKKDPKSWSRAFFREGINCEAVKNGFSECFNDVLVSLRHKPIITMLESMRVLAMERMHTIRLIMEKWRGEICPKIQAILEHTKDQQRFWHVIPGLLCVHAVACIFKLNKLVEPYVPSCFNTETFGLAYNQFMKPVEGITFWPDCSNLSRILGPIPKKMPGRPKKKRIRASHENKSSTKISRAGIPMTCQNCGEPGHNKKGCKNPTIPKPPKEKGKAGRPKKIVPTENENEVHDDDTPKFVNTSISEFDKAPSKNFVVFNDGKRVNLGTNWNKNKRGGKSASSYFVKMRGGKSSRGGLLPAERLGKIDKWLVVDGASSDTIDDTRALQSSHVATKSNQNDAGIIIGTQQSQVVGGVARMKGNAIEAQSPNSSPSTPIGVKMSRGKQSKTRYITNTSSSPPTARQIMSEPAAQHSPKNQVTPATQEAPQLRRRQQAQVLPQREKSQRILLRKVSNKITSPGSSVDNEIIILIRDEQRHRKNDDDDILNDDDVARVQRLKKELASKTVEIKCHRSKLGDGSNLHFFVLAVT
ncbi:pentatricopeptide repeat-containing protein [Tanacetum coccineum]